MLRTLREQLGAALGRGLAPLMSTGAAVRRARLFHPSGVVLRAEVEPCAQTPRLRAAAERLGHHAVVRMSAAVWKNWERRPEILGCAIRFCDPGRELEQAPGAQDVLLATVRNPFVLPVAPVLTHAAEFRDNVYYGILPFDVEDVGKARLRARFVTRPNGEHGTRSERLVDAARHGRAILQLELKRPLRAWTPLVRVHLRDQLVLDEEQLKFNPFLADRGIDPRGLIHAIRRTAYPASWRGRDHAHEHFDDEGLH